MKYLLLLPLAGLAVHSALCAQTVPAAPAASQAPSGGQIWPAIKKEGAEVRQRFENAMERRSALKSSEQTLARTERQLRAESEVRTRIRDAIQMQEQLMAQDQEALRLHEGDATQREALLQAQQEHQQLLELLHRQDEQAGQVQVHLQAQQQAQKAQRDQMRER